MEKLEQTRSKGGSVIGVPSGLLDLDEITSGFQDGDLIIVAGRPGMGKHRWPYQCLEMLL